MSGLNETLANSSRAGNTGPLITGPAHWAALPAEAVLAAFATGNDGLDDAEVANRLARHGPNSLPRLPRRAWQVELVANFFHLFALLLWAGAALAWFAGMPELSWAIIVVVLVNGSFSYWQEYQAERATEALQALLPHSASVRRAGVETLVAAEALVPGDILLLNTGDAVPADARLLSAERLRLDMSSLSGESRLIPRAAAAAEKAGRGTVELPNLVFAGTAVGGGTGVAVVFATGAATEFGRIAQLTQAQRELPSPLQREVIRLTRVVTAVAIVLGVLAFGVGTSLRGLSTTAALLFAIGMIVANVPEGLLPTLTLALALAVRRMAARNALVKRLSAVETLGATTVIVTDKTGTLTENTMTVTDLWTSQGGSTLSAAANGTVTLPGILPRDSSCWHLLRAAALCCDAAIRHDPQTHRWEVAGDPTEGAILVAAHAAGLPREALTAWPRLAELPFDSARKRMTTIQDMDGIPVACVKGASSEILSRCMSVRIAPGTAQPFDDVARHDAAAAHDRLARRGLRVLAVATRELPSTHPLETFWQAAEVETNLTFLGLIAMEDPPRPEVAAAISACRSAGIRVVMATGDNGLTAAAVGREIGLHPVVPRIITGAQLDALTDARLGELLHESNLLFARVSPEHKLRLVEAYQRRREIVAVTGDGVNDAPALKRAHIGVAMGRTGTDVAREAADMILADDNFASIVWAIEEGRTVYENIRKFVTYIFASNVPEIVPFVAFVLLGVPLPLTVMQILAVDLGTDLLPALALGQDPPEPGVMRRPPRPRSQRLLNWPTLVRAYAWLGLIEAALGLAGFFFAYALSGWRPGAPMADGGIVYRTATTMSLAGIVACQIGNAFACRSRHQSIWRLGFGTNRLLLWAIGAEIVLLVAVVYLPFLAAVFGTAPLGAAHWLLLVSFGPLLLAGEECRKLARRALGSRWRFIGARH